MPFSLKSIASAQVCREELISFVVPACFGMSSRSQDTSGVSARKFALQPQARRLPRFPGPDSGPSKLRPTCRCSASSSAHDPPPSTYPVSTPSRLGACFVVEAGYVATCEHTVRGENSISVGGFPATVVATCAADVALLSVPALSGASAPFLEEQHSGSPAAGGGRVQIRGTAGESVPATVVDMPGIVYSCSGAVLPALRLKVCGSLSDRGQSSLKRLVGKGWSGAPVVDSETNELLGMVVHGDHSMDAAGSYIEYVFAAPVGVLRCFISSSFTRANLRSERKLGTCLGRPWSYDIAGLAPLVVQPLSSPRSVAALREVSKRPGWKTSCDDLRAGVRIIRAPAGSGLQSNDVLLKAGKYPVDCDGFITRWGVRTCFHAAFIGADVGSLADVQVLRARGAGRAEVETVSVSLGRAAEVLVRVPAQSSGAVLLAGDGDGSDTQLVEISVEWLQEHFGEWWATCCGHDIYAAVFGDGGDSRRDSRFRSTVVIDHDCSNPELVGSRIVAAEGRQVGSLSDILRISKALKGARDLVVETADGWITTLRLPIKLVRDRP